MSCARPSKRSQPVVEVHVSTALKIWAARDRQPALCEGACAGVVREFTGIDVLYERALESRHTRSAPLTSMAVSGIRSPTSSCRSKASRYAYAREYGREPVGGQTYASQGGACESGALVWLFATATPTVVNGRQRALVFVLRSDAILARAFDPSRQSVVEWPDRLRYTGDLVASHCYGGYLPLRQLDISFEATCS